jgi:FdhE protein
LPETESLFSDRALRLKSLANGHALADYLRFIAEISLAQQRELDALPALAMPIMSTGVAPLSVSTARLDPIWKQVLHNIVNTVSAQAPRDYAARLQNMISTASESDLDQWAQSYLQGDTSSCDIAMLPMVAAALQVVWTAMTRSLQAGLISAHREHEANTCPVCNSLPVGSMVRSGAANQGLRYLTCSLCASQWNMERIRCIYCGDNQHVFYYGIENVNDAIQAEACDSCLTYSKIMHMEKNPAVDMVADDLATLSLDILVADAGFHRYGMNPMLVIEPDPIAI